MLTTTASREAPQIVQCNAYYQGISAVKIPGITDPSAVSICLTSFIFTAGISWNMSVTCPQESTQRGIYSTVTNLRSRACLLPGIPLHPRGEITQLTKNVTAPQNKMYLSSFGVCCQLCLCSWVSLSTFLKLWTLLEE